MATVPTTDWAFVKYTADNTWYERWVIGRVESSDSNYLCLTPDGDACIDCFDGSDANIDDVKYAARWNRAPVGVPARDCYRFSDEPTAADLLEVHDEGMELCRAMCSADWQVSGATPAAPAYLIPMSQVRGVPRPKAKAVPAPPAGGAAAAGAGAGVGGAAAAGLGGGGPGGGAGGVAPVGAGGGAPAGGGPAAAAAAGLPQAAALLGGAAAPPPPLGWVFVESTAVGARGADVVMDGTEISRGDVALKQNPAGWVVVRNLTGGDRAAYQMLESSADPRLIPIQMGPSAVRTKWQWREAVTKMTEDTFAGWPVPGPRTVLWCCTFINRRNGGPEDHVKFWVSSNGLRRDDWGVQDYENFMRILYQAACYDCVNPCNLASFEIGMRKCQLYEYVHLQERDSPIAIGAKGDDDDKDQKPKSKAKGKGRVSAALLRHAFVDEVGAFMGASKEHGDSMICPALLKHVGEEVEKDASVLKQVRKAREERAALRS